MKIIFPNVIHLNATTIAYDLVSVQPISMPLNHIWCINTFSELYNNFLEKLFEYELNNKK